MHRPDLAALYGESAANAVQPPVVIIPGLMGTRLVDDQGREVWPGPAWRVLTSGYPELALAVDGADQHRPQLLPGTVTDSVAGRDYYRSIMETLERFGGYRRAHLGTPPPAGQRSYYVFTYDWRQDLQETAAELNGFLARIRRDHDAPMLRMDVVAHSMGGLVTRYFVRYGDADVINSNDLQPTMAGAGYVRRVILLGTPNLGSIEAVEALVLGRRLGLRTIRPEVLATMPSMLQLLPHALYEWLLAEDGTPVRLDQFDLSTWRDLRWGIFDPKVRQRIRAGLPPGSDADAYLTALEWRFAVQLERARRFVWSLTVPAEPAVPLIVFGGDCTFTPARLVIDRRSQPPALYTRPEKIGNPVPGVNYRRLMLEPGDGSVSKASLLARQHIDPTVPRHRYTYFPLHYSFLLCAPHDRLPGNISFQDNLLDALLSAL